MNWLEVCEHPDLQDLPFKIELDETGKIIMSPTKVYHSIYQGEIAYLLRIGSTDGKTLVECAITTRLGTKVADVAWFSAARWQQVQDEYESTIAPEICIEVMSRSNSTDEIEEKKKLYFERGAVEVWVCTLKGKLRFYTEASEMPASALVPDFPKAVSTK